MKPVVKILLLVAMAPILLWGSVTWIIGSKTKASLMEASSAGFAFEESSYHRGFLRSGVTSRLNLRGAAEKDSIRLDHRIYHGPLLFTPDGTRVGVEYAITELNLEDLPTEEREIVDRLFPGSSPLTIKTLVGFDGASTHEIDVPSFKLSAEEYPDLGDAEFGGVQGTVKSGAKRASAKGAVQIGSLTVDNVKTGTTVITSAGEIIIDLREIYEGMVLEGDVSFFLPSFLIRKHDSSFLLGVKDVKLETRSQRYNEAIGSEFLLSVGETEFASNDPNAIPAELLREGGKLSMKLKGLDKETMKKVAEVQKKLKNLEKGEEVPPALKQEFTQLGLAALDVVQPGLEFSIGAEAGSSYLKLRLGYDGDKKLTKLKTWREAANAIGGEVSVNVNQKLLPKKQVAALLAQVEEGVLQNAGGYFTGLIEIAEGKLILNGEEMPLFQQLGPLLDQEIPWDKILP